ncbi:MAG: hypothetical protein AB1762_10390 [Gemmatimonadota bacterium]
MTTRGNACGSARRLLWPDGGPRAASTALIQAQEHLAQCEACQRFIGDMRVQCERVRALALRELAPAEVRRRLFTALARARAGGIAQPPARPMVPRAWLVAAIGLLVALGATLTLDYVTRHDRLDPISALADDHARALGAARISSSEPAVVSRWLGTQVDFAVLVPALPDAMLLGARLRVADGRRGVAILYEVDGVALTYFVVPGGSTAHQSSPGTGEPQLARLTRAGYRVVAWREPGLLHAMVGSLSETQLATLAHACIKQARGSVASLIDGFRSHATSD